MSWLYCFQRQWGVNGGKCGVCGDPWDGKRENEAGGKYANGIIARKYKPGETITVNVDLTANHLGKFNTGCLWPAFLRNTMGNTNIVTVQVENVTIISFKVL